MAGLTQTQLSDFYQSTISEPLPLAQIAETFKEKYHFKESLKTVYLKIYNFLKTKAGKAHFLKEQIDNILWVRANPQNPFFFSDSSLDLIFDKQSSENTKPDTGRPSENGRLSHLVRACPERLEAILKLNRVKSLAHYEEGELIRHNRVGEECDTLYRNYCKRVKTERLDMAYSPTGSPVFAENYTMKFRTRFTDPERQQANIDGFRAAWDLASSRHCVAVELTLTARPYGYSSLYECNRATLKAWSKMYDFLRYHLPDNVEIIAVREFQTSGRIHFHITLFGINWLLHKSVIQYAWRRYGGGEILDVHTIRRQGKSWQWSRKRPEAAAGQPPYDHLRKYLEKSMGPEEGMLFWAMGCRNWTASKTLIPKKEKQENHRKKHFLKGIVSKVTGFRPSRRSDSNAFFSGLFLRTRKRSAPKPKDKPKDKESFSVSFRTASDLFMQG